MKTTFVFGSTFLLAAALGLHAVEVPDMLPSMGGAPVVDTGSESAFNRNDNPVDESDLKLLNQRGYRLGDEGRLYAPGSEHPVSRNDFFYVLEEIRSGRRLQALLKIQLIQSRNGYSKDLPKKDREELRSIARDNWRLLSYRTREDLESLFSSKEVFEMKQEPSAAPLAAPASPMEADELPPDAAVRAESALQTLSGPLLPLGTQTAAAKPPAPRKIKEQIKPPAVTARLPTAARPPAGWNATTRGTVKPLPPPWKPDPQLPVKPLPAPWKTFKRAKETLGSGETVPPIKARPAPWAEEAQAPAQKPSPPPSAAPAPPTAPAAPAPAVVPEELFPQDPLPEEGFTPAERAMRETMAQLRSGQDADTGFRVETPAPPPVEIARGMAPVLPPAAAPPLSTPPPAAVARPQPKEIPVEYPEVDNAAFLKFIESTPYDKGIKNLLHMLARHVRDPERRAAIGILTTTMPEIVVDSVQAGREARASIGRVERGTSFARTRIAVHDGPVLAADKSLFSADRVFFMPDDARYFTERGKAMPAVEAYSRKSIPARELKGEFGLTRLYKDGSTRLKRSEHAGAGALLNALLRIDGELRGWVDDYHARLRADAVEFRFYRSIKADTETEPDLDAELLARYQEWFHRPEDYLDQQLNSYFERSREEELAMLQSAGVEGIGKSASPTEFLLPPSDSPAKRAWLESDRLARGDE